MTKRVAVKKTVFKSRANDKHDAFVMEYLIDKNGARAARAVGYKKGGARRTAARLIQIPAVKKAIDAGLEKQLERQELSQDMVIEGLKENARRAMTVVRARDLKGKPTGDFTYNGAVANRAFELLGKHLGMFSDKTEVDLNFNVTISRRDADGL